MLTRLKTRIRRQQGQTMAEYAVALGVITVATVAVLAALSGGVERTIDGVTGLV